ncbi:prepilin-type N-terminal cleavage/methylation domain-containing protein [Vibrio sinensis]|uniref:Prepilin-type N-terminal cleavage/methylation domain-containing protein n=1 Tax=Vibrio sinensis TaxID=2302434 RepID=A0A3A6QIN1_9VIBR|nr:prepilin-type N-terminal cleavage/methylation domain-containing protein [Vibrio sinensis]RJX70686.1 prepilin-type N-terminal cleavage/methylation domain-containing protein [Vibrio sinensis]
MKRLRGFTLIESVIVIVVMGLAMITIMRFLAPQIARSADPHYQTRAVALGQSIMGQILSKGFDQVQDPFGGNQRCSEAPLSVCTPEDGETAKFGPDAGETTPSKYNDVDDFKGCWVVGGTGSPCKDLSLLLEDQNKESYVNFRIDVAVTYQQVNVLKRIDLLIEAANQAPIELTAYRGNY